MPYLAKNASTYKIVQVYRHPRRLKVIGLQSSLVPRHITNIFNKRRYSRSIITNDNAFERNGNTRPIA